MIFSEPWIEQMFENLSNRQSESGWENVRRSGNSDKAKFLSLICINILVKNFIGNTFEISFKLSLLILDG